MRFIMVALVALTLSACAAGSDLCDNGRAPVSIASLGPSFPSCSAALQDAVDAKVAQGREYRILTVSEAMEAGASSGRVPAPSGPLGTVGPLSP